MSRQPIVLPSLYYYDHFQEMVRFVISLYGDRFGPAETDFLERFPALSLPARCLYVRMINRKRSFFALDELVYAEIGDVVAAMDELHEGRWVRTVCERDYSAFLGEMKKDRLHDLLRAAGAGEIKSSWSKMKFVEHTLANIPFGAFGELHNISRHYSPEYTDTVRFLLFLYFGKTHDSLTSFALRDLGLIQTKAKENYTARFQDMEEARAAFFYHTAINALKRGGAAELEDYASRVEDFPSAASDYARTLRNSTLFLIGQHFERRKIQDKAFAIYRLSDSFECRERLVRLVYAQDKMSAEKILSEMIADPSCDEELSFATDFYSRKFQKQKTGSHTRLLTSAQSISVDENFRGSPEQAALRHFKKSGWSGDHVENGLWGALFGLLFWEELFEQPDSYSSGFDRIPGHLRTKAFYARYEGAIGRKLDAVRNGIAAEIFREAVGRYNGEHNGLFGWYDGLGDIVLHFVKAAPPAAVARMLERMAKDFFAHCDGYPDLLLMRGSEMKFLEIKAEGDQVRRTQLVRIAQLQEAGFAVELLRVTYHVDPDQVYVVVDVETTGGRPPNDRVTEIGAVKIQNGVVIGEWSSLINPEKHIPSYITELTGISNAMVADAPRFAEVAESLYEFMDGAVFAAHSVNFDYGFIGSEFRRLDMPFRMPKLCTCASMRRHYPGHASYSLANMCKQYGIQLKEHHRAMCDARAAGELLILINEKRSGTARMAA